MRATAVAHCESEGKQFVTTNTLTGLTTKSDDATTLAVTGQCVGPGDPGYEPSLPHAPLARGAVSGTEQHVEFFYGVHPDCTDMGYPVVRIAIAPAHGSVRIENGTDYTNFPASNQRYSCNLKKSLGTLVYYTSEKGYTGPDTFDISIIFPDGTTRVNRYNMTVTGFHAS
jgi:hypothetical protein